MQKSIAKSALQRFEVVYFPLTLATQMLLHCALVYTDDSSKQKKLDESVFVKRSDEDALCTIKTSSQALSEKEIGFFLARKSTFV